MDLDHARTVAVEAAEAAGALIREGTRRALRVHAKGTAGDMVTDLDLASEKLLLERILTAFPSHAVIAEESGLNGSAGGEWTWLVDPLDGTNNVAIGLPAYVVGVALCRAGLPQLGVVHDPVSGQTWSAVRGGGALASSGGAAVGPVRAQPARPAAGLDPGLRHRQGRPDRAQAEGGARPQRPQGAAAVDAAAVVGDAGPRRHRRHRGLPHRRGGPAGGRAARAGGGHRDQGARRRPVRRVRQGRRRRAQLRGGPPARPAGAARAPPMRRSARTQCVVLR
ncbi:inositol monophosphatase family protein [Nonomuraea salmonea]|uniref:inositol monophosphatase family protein n=1 Tax=Nonomuraea salmonea TaxID=46181 RepID=UPI0031E96915